eukprot:c17933_g1_i1 orf=130-1059(+)
MAMASSTSTFTSFSRCTHIISLQADSSHALLRRLHLSSTSLPATWFLKAQILKWVPPPCKTHMPKGIPRAQGVESTAAGASADSVMVQVEVLEEVGATPGVESKPNTSMNGRRPSPLTRGGTLTGEKAAGKDPGLAALGEASTSVRSYGGPFEDVRWKEGTWDLQQFSDSKGKVDWDAVIDAEVLRRKWLEDNPEASLNEAPVVFGTSIIPWWAWVRRFHLPEAEILNGRAAMIGFFMGYVVDGLTGVGLVDQTNSFLGKLLLFVCVLGILFIRKNEDVENLKQLAQEWTFYDKQWQASWQDEQAKRQE